jgi:hypothetical protein
MSFQDSFRAARWIRFTNLLLQALLFLSFFGGLNYLARSYAWRHDLTQHRRHSLSPETRSYLRDLRTQVRLVVTLTDDAENAAVAQAWRDVRNLLREYVHATADNRAADGSWDGRIQVRYLDVFQQRREAEAFGVEAPNTILAISGENRRQIGLEELYRIEGKEKKAFRGEQALTAAILDVSNPNPRRIYFLLGHGEMRPDDSDPARGLSDLRDLLRLRNFELLGIDLAQTRKIPDDAALLILAAPQGPYDPFETELVRDWLSNRAGRVILLLAPGFAHGLDPLLHDWGLLADDVRIHDDGPSGQNEAGDLILRTLSKDSPITAVLLANEIPVRFGSARAARPDPGRAGGAGLDVKPLVATADTAWGERSYRLNQPARYDPGVDLPGPVVLASSSERVTPPNDGILPFSVRGGRVVLFGGADFAANGRIVNPGNTTLVLNAINWTVDRDTQLNIPARPIERFQLSLSQEEIARLRYSLLLGVPGAAALFGLIVYWTRRR